MKLAAMLAALSLGVLGCVDDVATGGGQLEGVAAAKVNGASPDGYQNPYDFLGRPNQLAKPSNDRMTDHLFDALGITPSIPTGGCKNCQVYATVETWDNLEEITVWGDLIPLCRIVRDEGAIVFNDCNAP